MSWQDATAELLAQYRRIIQLNLPKRETRRTYLGAFDSLLRAILVACFSYLVVRSYTKRAFKIGFAVIDDLLEFL